jgi:hypothetical protein
VTGMTETQGRDRPAQSRAAAAPVGLVRDVRDYLEKNIPTMVRQAAAHSLSFLSDRPDIPDIPDAASLPRWSEHLCCGSSVIHGSRRPIKPSHAVTNAARYPAHARSSTTRTPARHEHSVISGLNGEIDVSYETMTPKRQQRQSTVPGRNGSRLPTDGTPSPPVGPHGSQAPAKA